MTLHKPCIFVCSTDQQMYLIKYSHTLILCVRRLPEDATPVSKHVGLILIVNCVLWFIFYCVLLSTFGGHCIENMRSLCRQGKALSMLAKCYGHLADAATRLVESTSVTVQTKLSMRFAVAGIRVTEVCLQIRQVGRVFPCTQRQEYRRKPLEFFFRRVRKIVKSDC
jgi:hypothetical protein